MRVVAVYLRMTPDLILLVNDIPDHKGIYEAALRARGYQVRLTQTAQEAFAAALGARPACAVIDVRLPDIDGWELCRRFKAHDDVKHMPVVMLAQDVSTESALQGKNVGCTAWLAHPTVADDLVRAVEFVLAQGASEPTSPEDAVVGVSECPACASTRIRAGVGVGTVQYYCCRGCGLCWRVERSGEATA